MSRSLGKAFRTGQWDLGGPVQPGSNPGRADWRRAAGRGPGWRREGLRGPVGRRAGWATLGGGPGVRGRQVAGQARNTQQASAHPSPPDVA